MPWPVTSGLLARLSMIEFRRHAHTALVAQVAAQAFGGAKDAKLTDFLLTYAITSDKSGKGWTAEVLDSPKAEAEFKLAVLLGLVSQDVFNAVTN